MGKETVQITRVTCDGTPHRRCTKVLDTDADGIIVHGKISSPKGRTLLEPGTGETALCWGCFNTICVARPPAPQEYVPNPEPQEYESNYDYRPGKTPTGPLPPPELPQAVVVTAALCRRD